ncbi:acyltransferase family protein [Streptomyces sp. NPDC051018]|uniref:DUF459 domain-containing protein n=1 Tax=Streptomyces sp. NPDC051018 TaxID=3365639 RepID=UPI00378C8F44
MHRQPPTDSSGHHGDERRYGDERGHGGPDAYRPQPYPGGPGEPAPQARAYPGPYHEDGTQPYVPEPYHGDGTQPYTPRPHQGGGTQPYTPQPHQGGGTQPYVPQPHVPRQRHDDGTRPHVPEAYHGDGTQVYVPQPYHGDGTQPYVPEQYHQGGTQPYAPRQRPEGAPAPEPAPAPVAEPDPGPGPEPEREPESGRGSVPLKSRFAAVDGLRGIAILSVLLYHTNWFSNGLFGVDAFFVLSGFLTTLLLIREVQRNGRIRIGRFYRRRAKRLLPGLMVTLGAVVVISYLASPLKEARSVSEQALGSLLQIANWAQIARGDAYWDHFGSIQPLSAMWSLSITEQFYVVWPLVMVVAFAVFRRRVLPVAVLTVILFGGSALVAPLLWNGSNSDLLYLATHTRAVAFMAGAAAAFAVHLVQVRVSERGRGAGSTGTALASVVSIVCLAAILYVSVKVSTYHEPWLYQGGLAVVALLVAVLAATLCTDRGPLAKVLSFKPLMEIGQISYSMYLLHLPVYWLLLMAWPELKPYFLFVLGTGFTWLLAMIMHYSIEQVRVRDWRPSRAVPALTAAAAVIGAGAYYLPVYIADSMRPDGKQLVLTLGDSMAEDFATVLSRHGNGYAVIDGGQRGCGVMSPDAIRDREDKVLENWDACRAWPEFWKDQVEAAEPDAVLIHVGRDAAEQRIGGAWMTACDPAYRTRYLKQLRSSVAIVNRAAPEAKVLLLNTRRTTGAVTADWGKCFNDVVGDYVKASAGKVGLVDLDGFLCPGGGCASSTPEGKRLYPEADGVHLTDAGMGYVRPWLEKELASALK